MPHRRRSLSSALVVALVLALPLGCSGTRGMHVVEIPAEGITLAYDLVAGTVLDGHIMARESSGSAGRGGNRTAEFDVSMLIKGIDDSGSAAVKARVKNLQLDMSFGQMSDFVDAKAVISAAQRMVEGADIRFKVNAQGKVFDFPKASAVGDLDPMVQMALETVLDALEQSIYPVPQRALTVGATWEDQDVQGRKGKLGRFRETTTTTSFNGVFRPKDADDGVRFAMLEREDNTSTVTTTKEGGHEVSHRESFDIMFDINGGFVRKVRAVGTEVDGPATTTTRFEARWSKRTTKVTKTPISTSTQKITDPCDPNYVGAELCPGAPDHFADDLDSAPSASPGGDAPASEPIKTDESIASPSPSVDTP